MQHQTSNSTSDRKIAKVARTAFAATVSAGLVGLFVLPAYSSQAGVPEEEAAEAQYSNKFSQSLVTLDSPDVEVQLAALKVAENPDLLALERAEQEAEEERLRVEQERLEQEQAQLQQEQQLRAARDLAPQHSVPAGAGGGSMSAAALSQLGDIQDCTALVERSLRAAGVPAGDLGTQLHEYTALGGQVVGSYQPGDVLIWPGQHVAMYIGNGQVVHGGWNGYDTVIGGTTTNAGGAAYAVRF